MQLCDALERFVEQRGEELNADIPDKKKRVETTKRDASILGRLPPALFCSVLGWLSIPGRTRMDRLNKLLRLVRKDEPAWDSKLVLTAQDQITWFRPDTMARALPWLPNRKRLQRLDLEFSELVVTGVVELMNDKSVQASVRELRLKDGTAGGLAVQQPTLDLRAWKSLERLRFSRTTVFMEVAVVEKMLLSLVHCPQLISLRIDHLAWLSKADVLRSFAQVPTMWRGLKILGLRMDTIDTAWWTMMTRACPNLEKLVVHVSKASTFADESVWRTVGAVWPAMRFFVVTGPLRCTTAGFQHLRAWTQLECFRLIGPDVTPSVLSTVDFVACVAGWRRLRIFDVGQWQMYITDDVLAALNEHCPRLQLFGLHRVPPSGVLLTSTPQLASSSIIHFIKKHPGLRFWPVWSAVILATGNDIVHTIVRAMTASLPYLRAMALSAGNFVEDDVVIHALQTLLQLQTVTIDVQPVSDRLFQALGTRPRLLEVLQLTTGTSAHLTDASLDALAQSCPKLRTFHVRQAKADAAVMAASDIRISVGRILHMLRRCPQLTEWTLRLGPLVGLHSVTDDLDDLMLLHRRVACTVDFLVRTEPDVSDAWTAWWRKYTTPLALDFPTTTRSLHIAVPAVVHA
jgi:hypothetical protein